MICRAMFYGEGILSVLPEWRGKSRASICLVPGRDSLKQPYKALPRCVRDARSDSAGAGRWQEATAKTLADSTASSGVVAAIAPICVDQFQRSAAAGTI